MFHEDLDEKFVGVRIKGKKHKEPHRLTGENRNGKSLYTRKPGKEEAMNKIRRNMERRSKSKSREPDESSY